MSSDLSLISPVYIVPAPLSRYITAPVATRSVQNANKSSRSLSGLALQWCVSFTGDSQYFYTSGLSSG